MMIELTDQEALAFRLLAESGAWNLKKGSATLHFDRDGYPTTVEVRSITTSQKLSPTDIDGLQVVL